jgi:putative two-component system response regulator
MIWHGQIVGSLGVASMQEQAFGPRDAQFLAAVATQVTAIFRMANLVVELQSSAARLSEAQTETVMLLASVAEARDQTTDRHLHNVRALSEALARELGYGDDDARELGLAAVLHDIGKIRVPDHVLANTHELRDDQWDLIRQHARWGAELLAGHPGFELAATIAGTHHERWDGSGYPDGLAGDALPEAAAIVAVADAFDAIVDSRPYSKSRSVAHAVREITACAGQQFSPKVVDALQRLYKEHRLPIATRSRRAA